MRQSYFWMATAFIISACGSPNPEHKRYVERDPSLNLTPTAEQLYQCTITGLRGRPVQVFSSVDDTPACVSAGNNNDGITVSLCLTKDGAMELDMTAHSPSRQPVRSTQSIPAPALGTFALTHLEYTVTVACHKRETT